MPLRLSRRYFAVIASKENDSAVSPKRCVIFLRKDALMPHVAWRCRIAAFSLKIYYHVPQERRVVYLFLFLPAATSCHASLLLSAAVCFAAARRMPPAGSCMALQRHLRAFDADSRGDMQRGGAAL